MCRHFREDYGLTTRVARFHNVYGPQGTFDGGREKAPAAICRKVIQAQLSGRHEIEIWGDGEQTRSFMFIDDCVEGT
jgi:nucleoside-diphosphate-sugar epimerase